MTIQLGSLEWAAQLAGIPFPDADEDALWRCARAWHGAADQLRRVPPAAAEIGNQVAEAVAGETAARFEEAWRPIGAADGPLVRLADACDGIAAGCDWAATEIEQAKLLIRAELSVLAATVAVFAALPGVGLIGGVLIAQAIGAARLAILVVLERLVRVVGGPIAALLDLRGVVAHVRALLGLLAGSPGLGSLAGGGDPSTGTSPSGGAGGSYAMQPNGLFGPVLPQDLSGAFDTARALLLAGLPSLHGGAPQGTVPPPSTPDTTGGPVLSAGTPTPYPNGPVPAPPPPAVPAPAVPAPAVPVPSPPVPIPAPTAPVPPPAAPAPPPGAPTPTPPPTLPPPGAPTPTPPAQKTPAPVTSPAPRPAPPIPSAPTAVPPSPPMVTPPAGPPPPTPVVAAAPGPPAVPNAPGPGIAPVAVVVARPGTVDPPTPGGVRGAVGRDRTADAGTTDAAAPVPLTDAEALARARAYLFATDAGYGFHPPGDENRDLARAVPPTPGQVAVDLLGDAEGFTIDNGRLTPAQLADVLRELIGAGELAMRPGESVRLLSGCAAGPAATLAAGLGIELFAPSDLLWTYLDGPEIVAGVRLVQGVLIPVDPPDGWWCSVGGYETGSRPAGSPRPTRAAP